MSLPPKLPRKIPANNSSADTVPPDQEYKCIVSFIEPLAFLQFKAHQYNYLPLGEGLQKCVDEIYAMLEIRNFYN